MPKTYEFITVTDYKSLLHIAKELTEVINNPELLF